MSNYEDVLFLMLYSNASEKCFFQECHTCPKTNFFENILNIIFQKHQVDTIKYKHWVSQPRAALITIKVSAQKFIQNLCQSSKTFLTHSFVARQQATCYRTIKENLQFDQCLAVCDFAENYAFVVQNAVTRFHWNNDQATILPIVFYYNDSGSIEHKTVVFISDCKKHDAVAVYMFLQSFNDFLSSSYQNIREFIYFSDGAPQQFKNVKHFSTIYYH